MSKYLYILNWIMAIAVILTWFFLKPIFGLAVFVGSVFGGMLTAGFISWQYHKDSDPDKAEVWRESFFHKDYSVEILVQIGLVSALLGLALCFWQDPLAFVGGIAMMWCLNVIVEALWYRFVEKNRK